MQFLPVGLHKKGSVQNFTFWKIWRFKKFSMLFQILQNHKTCSIYSWLFNQANWSQCNEYLVLFTIQTYKVGYKRLQQTKKVTELSNYTFPYNIKYASWYFNKL